MLCDESLINTAEYDQTPFDASMISDNLFGEVRVSQDLRASVVLVDENLPILKKEYLKLKLDYRNPYKWLVRWASQEVLDLKALQEAFSLMEALDDKRRKLQKAISLTDAQMKVIRPAHTTTVRSLFDATSNADSEIFNKKF